MVPAIRQRTPEWLAWRRTHITATDIGAILGVDDYRCEADVADDKLNPVERESSIPMQLGSFLEPFLLRQYAELTGTKATAWRGVAEHPTIPWAGASPDARVGKRRLVELKWTSNRGRFADGLPPAIEAQVQWQLGVTGYREADVLALSVDEPKLFTVQQDGDLFADMVAAAMDFRRRLAAGGPYARSLARIHADHPVDDGSVVEADADRAELVDMLLRVRASQAVLEAQRDQIEKQLKAWMGDHAVLTAPAGTISWKRRSDMTVVDWPSVAAELHPSPELVAAHTTVRPGPRVFTVKESKA